MTNPVRRRPGRPGRLGRPGLACRTLASAALAALLGLGALAPAARADDWPQWRGPQRNGQSKETGLLKEWPSQGPPLAWKARGIGSGFSSVAVVGDRIYTLGDKDGQSVLFCLDAANAGKILWQTPFAPVKKQGYPDVAYPGTRATPTVDGDRIFVMNANGDLACISTADGKLAWSKSLRADLGAVKMDPDAWGFGESPLVDGDLVLVVPGGPKGAVVALDKATGQVAWRSDAFTDPAAYSSLVPATIHGVKQYVLLTDKSVAGIAPGGKVLWKAPRPGKVAVIPDPVVKDDLVFVSSGYKVGCNLFKVTKSGDAFEAKEVYANARDMQVHHGGLVLLGDHVYGSSDPGFLTCMELATGKVVWKDREPGKGSITYADGLLILRSENGPITLVEATPNGYVQKGQFSQPERSREKAWPHPVVANGKLYIRDQDLLLCYDVKAK